MRRIKIKNIEEIDEKRIIGYSIIFNI